LTFQLGVVRALTGDFDGAQAAFERAASLEPASDLPGAGLQLATIQRSRLPEAIAGLRRQVTEKPRSGILRCLLGMALVRNGVNAGSTEEQEAMDAFRQAARLEPDLPYPYIELGKLYMHQSRPAEAVPFLQKAAQMPATARAAAYQLAIAYRALNQPEQSRQMFARVRKLAEAERSNNFVSSAEKP
jgi:Flp pilus assembly protein TadD